MDPFDDDDFKPITEPLPFSSSRAPKKPLGPTIGKLEPEYADAWQAWKNQPTPAARGTLLQQVQPLIQHAVKPFGGGPTLAAKAKVMASQSFDSYVPEKGTLKNHLIGQLQGLHRAAARGRNVITLPERVMRDRQFLVEAENSLSDELGRLPSDMEIADRTGMSLKRLKNVRGLALPTNTGRFAADEDNGEDAFEMATKTPGQDDGGDAWLDFVYHDLGPIDQAVIDLTLGLHGSPKLQTKQIAAKLGVTPGAVSQRAARIQGMLNERSTLGLF